MEPLRNVGGYECGYPGRNSLTTGLDTANAQVAASTQQLSQTLSTGLTTSITDASTQATTAINEMGTNIGTALTSAVDQASTQATTAVSTWVLIWELP